MAIPVIPNSGDPSATNPDGSAAFPLNVGGAGAGGGVAQGSTTAGQTGTLVQGAVTTASPTYVTANTNPLSLTTRGEVRVGGPEPFNGGIAGNPLGMGGLARTTLNTAVTNNGVSRLVTTTAGYLVNTQWSVPELTWQFAVATGGIVNTTTAVTIIAAAGASIRNYCNSLSIAADLLTTASEIAIRDGAAGPVLWRGKLLAATLPQTLIKFEPPLRGTANTLMEFVTLTATGAAVGVFISAQGFQAY